MDAAHLGEPWYIVMFFVCVCFGPYLIDPIFGVNTVSCIRPSFDGSGRRTPLDLQ